MPPALPPLPQRVQRNIAGAHGAVGEAWLAEAPALLERICREWALTPQTCLPGGYNLVLSVTDTAGAPAVLKAGPDLAGELAALQHFAGRGAVRVHRADAAAGVLLLERLRPGIPLIDRYSLEQDDACTVRIAKALQALPREAPGGADRAALRLTADLQGGFARWAGHPRKAALPVRMVDQARALWAVLEADAAPAVVLHGDLHDENLLHDAARGWVAIDPHGYVGDPAFEAGAWMRNPVQRLRETPHLSGLLQRRIAVLSDRLGHDPRRLLAWSFAQAVLATWWAVESGDAVCQDFLLAARALERLRPG